MNGEPTALTEVMHGYADGKMTWPEARAFILDFPYRRVVRAPMSPYSSGLTPWYYGTWDEVTKGLCEGLLTDDEYGDLLEALEALEAREDAEKDALW